MLKQGNKEVQNRNSNHTATCGILDNIPDKNGRNASLEHDKSELNVDSQSLFPHLENKQNNTCVRTVLCNPATPQTVACQAPLSMGFSRPESWSGQPFPSPGDLPNPGSKPRSSALQADSLPAEPQGKPNKLYSNSIFILTTWTSPSVSWSLC